MKKWRFDFRIWHWVHAAVILALLGTVFLRKTFLSWKTNSELLAQKLAEINLEVTAEQAKMLAKAIRAPLWEWHIILGYTLIVLIIWRIALFFTASGQRSFTRFRQANLHKKVVIIGYVGIYMVLLFMAITGLSLHFHEELKLGNKLVEDIKEIHELVYYAVLVFVPLHIIGVVIADITTKKGIISMMINGGRQ